MFNIQWWKRFSERSWDPGASGHWIQPSGLLAIQIHWCSTGTKTVWVLSTLNLHRGLWGLSRVLFCSERKKTALRRGLAWGATWEPSYRGEYPWFVSAGILRIWIFFKYVFKFFLDISVFEFCLMWELGVNWFLKMLSRSLWKQSLVVWKINSLDIFYHLYIKIKGTWNHILEMIFDKVLNSSHNHWSIEVASIFLTEFWNLVCFSLSVSFLFTLQVYFS